MTKGYSLWNRASLRQEEFCADGHEDDRPEDELGVLHQHHCSRMRFENRMRLENRLIHLLRNQAPRAAAISPQAREVGVFNLTSQTHSSPSVAKYAMACGV